MPDDSPLTFDSLEQVMTARRRLETAGIPTRLKETRSHGIKQFSLSPVFERQLADAIALQEDPTHKIQERISDEERTQARAIIAREQQGNILQIAWQMSQIITVGLLIAAGVVWLVHHFGS